MSRSIFGADSQRISVTSADLSDSAKQLVSQIATQMINLHQVSVSGHDTDEVSVKSTKVVGKSTDVPLTEWLQALPTGVITGGSLQASGVDLSVEAATFCIKSGGVNYLGYSIGSTPITLTLTEGVNHIVGTYTGSGVAISASTVDTSNGENIIFIGECSLVDGVVTITQQTRTIQSQISSLFTRMTEDDGVAKRINGVLLGSTGLQFTVSSGEVYIGLSKITFPAKLLSGIFTNVYYDGSWYLEQVDAISPLYYNNTASGKVAITANYYKADHVYAAKHGEDFTYYVVMSQAIYSTVEAARDAVQPTLLPNSIIHNHPIYLGKLVTKQGATSMTVLSSFLVSNVSSEMVAHLSAITNPHSVTHAQLTDSATGDPHTQYILSAGRAGGQSITGGTASAQNLTLDSTSNATKGIIRVGSRIEPLTAGDLNIGSATKPFNTLYTDFVTTPAICGTESASGDMLLYSSWNAPRDGSIKMYCGEVLPSNTTGTTDLGASTSRWKDFYTTTIDCSGALACGAITAAGDIIAANNSVFNLGSATVKYKYCYLNYAIYTPAVSASTSTAGANLTLRTTGHATKGRVIFEETTESTSITTGCATFAGGVGIEKNLHVGGDIVCNTINGAPVAQAETDTSKSEVLLEDFLLDTLDAKWNSTSSSGTVTINNATLASVCALKTTANFGYATVKSRKSVNVSTQAFEVEFRVKGVDTTGGRHIVGLQQDSPAMSLFIDKYSSFSSTNWCLAIVDGLDNQILTNFAMTTPRAYTAGQWLYWKITNDKSNIRIYSKLAAADAWTLNHTIPTSQFANVNAQMTSGQLTMTSSTSIDSEMYVDYAKFTADRV